MDISVYVYLTCAPAERTVAEAAGDVLTPQTLG